MKIEINDYFKDKYKTAYLITDRTGRNDVHLISIDGKSRKCISYAKYLWMSHYKQEVPQGYEVDHINNDKTDDRIENLQILTKDENRIKEQKLHPAKIIKCICPICGKEFDFPKRNLNSHPNPCCSRKCGTIKAHKSNVKQLKLDLTKFKVNK